MNNQKLFAKIKKDFPDLQVYGKDETCITGVGFKNESWAIMIVDDFEGGIVMLQRIGFNERFNEQFNIPYLPIITFRENELSYKECKSRIIALIKNYKEYKIKVKEYKMKKDFV